MPTPELKKPSTRAQLPDGTLNEIGQQRLGRESARADLLPTFSKSLLSFVTEIVKVVLISVAIIAPIRYFLIQPFYVKGASMEPNFHDNEYLIIDEISFRFRQPARGEVVVLKNPRGEKDFYIKRIIGLPGDRVVIQNDTIQIFNVQYPDGVALNERAYLSPTVRTSGDLDLNLQKDQYFVLGDNRPASLDSRAFGFVTRSEIVGRTWIRAWPPGKMRAFSAPVYQYQAP